VVDLGQRETGVEVRVGDLLRHLDDHRVGVIGIAEDNRVIGE
jgi:hypothetical protein